MSSKPTVLKFGKTPAFPTSKPSSRFASPVRSTRDGRRGILRDGISRPQTPNNQDKNNDFAVDRKPSTTEPARGSKTLKILSNAAENSPRETKHGGRASPLAQKTESSLSGQPRSQNPLPRDDPRYQAWSKFLTRFESAMAIRVTAADMRLKLQECRRKFREANAELYQQITDAEALEGDVQVGPADQLSLLSAAKTLCDCAAELDAAAEAYYQTEEDLVVEESLVYDQAPSLLSEREETFEALKRLGFDFHQSDGSDGPESHFSWTSRMLPTGDDAGAKLSSTTRKLSDLEDQILVVRRERRILMKKALGQDPEDWLEPDKAAMSLLDEKHQELEFIYAQAHSELQWVRDTTSDESHQSSQQEFQESGAIIPIESPDTETHDSPLLLVLINSLFLGDAHQVHVYAGLDEVEDPIPTSDRINLWLLHQLRRQRLELARLASTISRKCDLNTQLYPHIAIDVFTRLWCEDGRQDSRIGSLATRPMTNRSSVEMNVAATGVAISNLTVSHPPGQADLRSP